MRATGIVRRIDDLGRVVIPKEIRRQMRIKEGDPLEIYTYDGCVCFKKYSPIEGADFKRIANVLKHILTCGFALADNGGEVKFNYCVDNLAKWYDEESESYVSNEVFYEGDLMLHFIVNKRDAGSPEVAKACKVIFEMIKEYE